MTVDGAYDIAEELPVKVSADSAYQNAMKNSDKLNARIEHDKALERAVIELLFRPYRTRQTDLRQSAIQDVAV